MESFLVHEYSPHAVGVGVVLGVIASYKTFRRICSTCFIILVLSGWLAALFMFFKMRWHSMDDQLKPPEL